MNTPDKKKIEYTYGCPIDWERCQIATLSEVAKYIHSRPYDGHKGTFGHGLLIAGKRSMAGAAILSTRAALRSGVGLFTVHTPTYNTPILQSSIPEAIISEDKSATHFTQPPQTTKYDAIAIGPGLGTAEETSRGIAELLKREQRPLIMDADALNCIGTHRELLNSIPDNSILTPHYRELQRIAGKEFTLNNRLQEASKLANDHQLYVIVKGAYSAIACPDGQTIFNTTGNAGMATAGSGDVLTGILLALLAQKYPPREACIVATYVHGLAGDLAAVEIGQISLIASDIIEYLPQAWNLLHEQKETSKSF